MVNLPVSHPRGAARADEECPENSKDSLNHRSRWPPTPSLPSLPSYHLGKDKGFIFATKLQRNLPSQIPANMIAHPATTTKPNSVPLTLGDNQPADGQHPPTRPDRPEYLLTPVAVTVKYRYSVETIPRIFLRVHSRRQFR